MDLQSHPNKPVDPAFVAACEAAQDQNELNKSSINRVTLSNYKEILADASPKQRVAALSALLLLEFSRSSSFFNDPIPERLNFDLDYDNKREQNHSSTGTRRRLRYEELTVDELAAHSQKKGMTLLGTFRSIAVALHKQVDSELANFWEELQSSENEDLRQLQVDYTEALQAYEMVFSEYQHYKLRQGFGTGLTIYFDLAAQIPNGFELGHGKRPRAEEYIKSLEALDPSVRYIASLHLNALFALRDAENYPPIRFSNAQMIIEPFDDQLTIRFLPEFYQSISEKIDPSSENYRIRTGCPILALGNAFLELLFERLELSFKHWGLPIYLEQEHLERGK